MCADKYITKRKTYHDGDRTVDEEAKKRARPEPHYHCEVCDKVHSGSVSLAQCGHEASGLCRYNEIICRACKTAGAHMSRAFCHACLKTHDGVVETKWACGHVCRGSCRNAATCATCKKERERKEAERREQERQLAEQERARQAAEEFVRTDVCQECSHREFARNFRCCAMCGQETCRRCFDRETKCCPDCTWKAAEDGIYEDTEDEEEEDDDDHDRAADDEADS